MNDIEMTEELQRMGTDFSVEEADEGDVGYYAYVNGGYLPNNYATWAEAIEAIYNEVVS